MRYYVQSAPLAMASEYFRCLLDRWCDPSDPSIRLTLVEAEAAVVEPLLQFIHTGRLPSIKPLLLLGLLKLADKYGVTACVQACAEQVLQRERALTLDALVDCLDLSERANIADNILVRRLLERAEEALNDTFGDLEEVWLCETTRQRLLQLPVQALKCLLSGTRLKLHSENTAFVAVTVWLQTNFPRGGAALGPEEQQEYQRCARELATWIRFPQLSTTFLSHIVKCVEWFQFLECHQYVWEEAMKFKAACPEKQAHVAMRVTRDHRYLPRHPSSVVGLTFEWHVGVEEIRGTLDKPPWNKNFLESERYYFGGTAWGFSTQLAFLGSSNTC